VKAAVFERYGPPEVLEVVEVAEPAPEPEQVRAREPRVVDAAYIASALDYARFTLKPYGFFDRNPALNVPATEAQALRARRGDRRRRRRLLLPRGELSPGAGPHPRLAGTDRETPPGHAHELPTPSFTRRPGAR
jgi:hypothetical protein